MFKANKTEVENQFGRRIKNVRSDYGDEYYGRYNGSREQCSDPYVKFQEECGIIPLYTMLRSPSMNGVVKRQNRTRKDMVMSMISHFTLSKSLQEEAIKTTAYILNKGPSKVTVKGFQNLKIPLSSQFPKLKMSDSLRIWSLQRR